MFNPFYPFTTPLLEAFIKQGKIYFVRQTFRRAKNHFEEGIKGCYLITHYDTLHEAQVHFDAIAHDPNRFLYDWNKEEHKERLKAAAGSPAGYNVYSSTFQKNWERMITDRMKKAIRLYVASLGWQPSRGEGVSTDFYQVFGELYIRLKSSVRVIEVKFEEIEHLG